MPVLAGVIETTTNKVIECARAAARQGADALVATAPFYTRAHATETDRHFRLIAAAVDLPLFAYDIPVCVHSKLDRSLVMSLAIDGVLAGVKDSSGDDVSFRRLAIELRAVPGFALLTGHEVVVDAMLLGGADGCVPGLGNVDPHGYRRLQDAADRGDWAAARTEQDRLAELFDIVSVADPADSSGTAAGIGAFKTALRARGVIANNTVSPPMRHLNEQEARAITGILDRAGLM